MVGKLSALTALLALVGSSFAGKFETAVERRMKVYCFPPSKRKNI